MDGWDGAAELYSLATRRYEAREAFAGLARCELRLNKDGRARRDAIKSHSSSLVAVAEARVRIRRLIAGHLPGSERILAVRSWAGTDWVVLTGEPEKMPEIKLSYYGVLRMRRADAQGRLVGKSTEVDVNSGTTDATLETWADGMGRPTAISTHCILSEGCIPGDLVAFRWDGQRFKKRLFLPMKYGIKAWPSRGRLVISDSPTYKVYWADIY